MAHKEAEIVRWHLSFKEQDHVLSSTRRGRNHEVALVLQRARPRTSWWHTQRQKSWGGACPSKWETTYSLMAHEEAEIMRWCLSFKERDHIHTDGTQRDQNREVALVFQRGRPRTPWWHEGAEIMRWHLSFKEQDHILSDGTRKGENREVAFVLPRTRPRTAWWHTKRRKSWGGTCPSKSETTYTLMAHEEAEIVRWHLSFKDQDHVLSDGIRRCQNREVALVLQRAKLRTTWSRKKNLSESLSKGLDNNVLIHSHCKTWNAEVMWDACFKAYLQIGLTLCTAWVNVSSKDEIRTFWMHAIQSINTFLTENSVMTHFLKMKATILKISNHWMIGVTYILRKWSMINLIVIYCTDVRADIPTSRAAKLLLLL